MEQKMKEQSIHYGGANWKLFGDTSSGTLKNTIWTG